MKALFILLSLVMASLPAIATEIICEPQNGAAPYSTLRIQIMGLIPIKDEFKNGHLIKISNKLIPYLKEQCATSATSENILHSMLSKCQETAKEVVDKENLEAYNDNCELGFSLARAYISGAKDQTDKCESRDGVSELSRTTQKIIEKTTDKSNVKNSSSVTK